MKDTHIHKIQFCTNQTYGPMKLYVHLCGQCMWEEVSRRGQWEELDLGVSAAHIYVHNCICKHTHARAHTHTHTHKVELCTNQTWSAVLAAHIYTNTHTHTHIHTHTQSTALHKSDMVCSFSCTHTCIYKHTHTHTDYSFAQI